LIALSVKSHRVLQAFLNFLARTFFPALDTDIDFASIVALAYDALFLA
jgi:hypothetical protein